MEDEWGCVVHCHVSAVPAYSEDGYTLTRTMQALALQRADMHEMFAPAEISDDRQVSTPFATEAADDGW
jgi:hypothetical protein